MADGLQRLESEYHRVRAIIGDNSAALNAGTDAELCSRTAHLVFALTWADSLPGGGGGARYPEPRLAEGANRRKLFFLHPQRMGPVLDSCTADVRARIVRMVETLRECYEWTAEWLNPLFRTQSGGAWGPRGSDMPAAPHARTRLEPMPSFTSGPPGGASGGASSSTDNGDGTGAGGAESPAGHASSRTRSVRAAHDAAREEAAASATAAAQAAAAREAARATRDARARTDEAAAHREQERRARAEAERLRVESEARHAREAREAEAMQAAADAAAEAARQRAADAQGRQGPATQPQFPEPAVPNLGGRRPESAEEYGYSWAAIDSIAIEECVVNPCSMLEDVPSQYTSAYAKVYVDILATSVVGTPRTTRRVS